MPTPKIPPTNTQLLGPMVDGFTVGQWCSSPDGSGPATAVAVIFNLQQVGDVMLRLKSRRAVDEMIAALEEHRNAVFGDRSA